MIPLFLLLSIPPLLLLLITLIHNSLLLPWSIPGPLLARFTNLYRLFLVYRTAPTPHEVQHALQNTHGDIVRLGPNVLSVRGPQFPSQIYSITSSKTLRKSDFYACLQNIVNGKRAASLVAMTDEAEHARTKRAIAHAYSLTKLVEFEALVDSTVTVFLDILSSRFAKPGKKCDLGRYLQFFAFDVIGELTFSKRLGFLKTGEDVNGVIAAIGANFRWFSVVGQMPRLDGWLGKNPIYVKYLRKPVSSPILLFAQRLLQERLDELDDEKSGLAKDNGANGANDDDTQNKQNEEEETKPDFLSKFLAARNATDTPELMGDRQLLSYLFMNINAGSDTIGSTLKGIFYYLLTNPSSMQTLVHELDDAREDGRIQNTQTGAPTWFESQSLPYLHAVVKEGLRLNPALSLSLERVVMAEGGMVLNTSITNSPNGKTGGQYTEPAEQTLHLPKDTVIGINPYTQHRDRRIFGVDADQWRPERWLTDHEKDSKYMEHALLTFGMGKRTCLGRHVAMLELVKVVPAVLAGFEVMWAGMGSRSGSEVKGEDGGGDGGGDREAKVKRGEAGERKEEVKGGSDWKVVNKWVLDQSGLIVDLKER